MAINVLQHSAHATGDERKLEVRGLFYGIGHTPNSRLVEGQVELDDKGYVKVSTFSEHIDGASSNCLQLRECDTSVLGYL